MSADLQLKLQEIVTEILEEATESLSVWEIDFLNEMDSRIESFTVSQGEKILEIARKVGAS